MLKPVIFVKPRNVGGPLYQAGEVAGFPPDMADALIRDGSARAAEADDAAPPPSAPPADDVIGTVSGFPFKTTEERQAAAPSVRGRKGAK